MTEQEFDKVIEKTSELLDFFADSACRSPIINIIGDKTYLLTGDFLFATSKTLKSISACCGLGSFADANMLIRKYRDDLFLYLYIIESSNNNRGLTEEELNEIINGEITNENLMELVSLTFSIMSLGIRKDEQNKAVDAWFNNTAENGKFYKYLDINNYLKYLKSNKLVKTCIEKHGLEDMWKDFGRKQNNYTHNNGRSFLTDNINSCHENKKIQYLIEQVHKDIAFITSYFLTILILIKPDYISSSDYIDFMEAGISPPSDCQYWVAPIVQDYLDEFVTKLHIDIKVYLRDSNPYGMKIL